MIINQTLELLAAERHFLAVDLKLHAVVGYFQQRSFQLIEGLLGDGSRLAVGLLHGAHRRLAGDKHVARGFRCGDFSPLSAEFRRLLPRSGEK